MFSKNIWAQNAPPDSTPDKAQPRPNTSAEAVPNASQWDHPAAFGSHMTQKITNLSHFVGQVNINESEDIYGNRADVMQEKWKCRAKGAGKKNLGELGRILNFEKKKRRGGGTKKQTRGRKAAN
ncbi:hypothetical protein L596_015264 [Steinernema carpocapsae]|uniref:Uncharacterized protein n=1 Tax=Steinernema carpocapsae TaxID=34508 RepID=A0A4U5NEP2_STECR|nr:hypothetical protein L596_015264 [Steinernema carpocapsae]